MRQSDLLHRVEDINSKIASLNSIIRDFEVNKRELLLKCKHKDLSGKNSVDFSTGVCWICERRAITE